MLGGRYVYAALLALASFNVTSAQLNINHICALVNDGLMIASNEACDTYYVCSGGIATMQYCNPGMYFNKEYQGCQPQNQVNCLVPSTIPCEGYSVGTWAPVYGSCSGFYYCSANGALRSNCPNGENFNPTTQSCVFNTLYPCSQSIVSDGSSNEATDGSGTITVTFPVNLCNFIPNGLFFGSAGSCNGWSKCVNNVLTTGVCPNGYLYNVWQMACGFPADVTCSQVTNDPYLTENNCTIVSEIKPATSCSSYYICDGSHYHLVECPYNLYFDTVSQTCVNRENARNNCDRCAGVTSSFVNMYSPLNCTGYLYCVNGVEITSGFCGSGSYFDERVGGCVQTAIEPMLGCCNPAFYDSSNPAAGNNAENTSADDSETTEASVLTTE